MLFLTLDELIETLLDADEEFCACGTPWSEHGSEVSLEDAFNPKVAT